MVLVPRRRKNDCLINLHWKSNQTLLLQTFNQVIAYLARVEMIDNLGMILR
jgi:hypothetical protein